ncbi:MAG: fused MFS/spermidine synthase [Vicinamibacteria bacterium]|nr:fused MFS/spermidine synthase [Vicinamibacteria bacterium]
MTQTRSAPPSPNIPLLALLFMGSGFSALAYQVILSRYAQLIVGGTAFAISALLVAFMLGMSVGSFLGGRWADRMEHPLRLYALAEVAIGVYCVAFPFLFPQLTALYLSVVPPIGESSFLARNMVRFAFGVGAFVLPTFFMGITTPAFARAVASQREDSGSWLARLYGWNTFGAALGALATAYVLVPNFGLLGSMTLATLINFSIAIVAYRVSFAIPTSAHRSVTVIPGTEKRSPRQWTPVLVVFLLASFASGFLSFALEIIWTHVLALLLGNSVYAFGLMLGSLLLGLSIGSVIARRLTRPPERARTWIGVSLALAGAFVLVTLSLWDKIPSVFLLFAWASPSFALMEWVRFMVAFALMVLPTAAFGITFPLTLHCATGEGVGFGEHVGKVYAVNTIGAVLGALSGPYLFLPWLGSLDSLKALSSLLLVCGGLLILTLASFPRKNLVAGLAVSSILWIPLLPISWDFNALNMAAAIYLGDSSGDRGSIIYKREDATGGLTSVVKDREVLTLLTNGKFQGDNSEEIPIQHRLANIPTLFTPARERALVIGLGTGVTLAALTAHGFEEMVCAEISEPIIEAAANYFGDVNGGIVNAPNVRMLREDGRSVLLESPKRYDVISVEVTTIWFAGAGSLYSQEFYRLASQRLRRGGVLLQWFPIHHLSARNLFVVVNTVRSVFPHVSLWTHRHQAFVVASNQPQAIDLESIRADRTRGGMKPYLNELASGSALELLSDLVVTDRDMDRFLNSMAELLRTRRSLVSTDAWPTLEYETPKDLLENFSYFQNRATFRRFRSTTPFPFRGVATPQEAALGEAAFVRGWSDPRAVARLSALWEKEAALSGAASQWLFDELTGEDALGVDLGSDPTEDLRASTATLGAFIGGVGSEASCSPVPVFLSRVDSVPLKVAGHSGASLDGTRPERAVDGIFDPALSPGWRVRPDGRPVQIDVDFDSPREVESIDLIVQAIDGQIVRARFLGRDEQGRWHPLVSGSQETDIVCGGQRTHRLTGNSGRTTGLRVILQGEGNSFRLALYELRVQAAVSAGAGATEP